MERKLECTKGKLMKQTTKMKMRKASMRKSMLIWLNKLAF